ncbi:hypothetical protein [Desulfovibrio sp.]|uniref:hypothetical protein n=1 Tax=Desulfovibrio sp. TaxID=885 RepID=UPI003D150B93
MSRQAVSRRAVAAAGMSVCCGGCQSVCCGTCRGACRARLCRVGRLSYRPVVAQLRAVAACRDYRNLIASNNKNGIPPKQATITVQHPAARTRNSTPANQAATAV